MTRFTIEDRFPTTLARFEALLDDPDLYPRLARELPGLDRIELISSEESDGLLHRQVRYTPRADDKIPAYARGLITPEMLIWTEHSTFHRSAHRIDYHIEPNLPPRWRDRFVSRGSFHLSEANNSVLRRIEGEVIVHATLVGRLAERLLIREVERGFRADVAVLTAWLAERR